MRIAKLDGLRGIFCIMIFLFHYQQITFSFGKIIPDVVINHFFIRESYIFVDFFFVLSGFVISYNYNKLYSIKDFTNFIKKRFIRLYPLVLFTVLLVVCFEVIAKICFPHLCLHTDPFSHIFIKILDTLCFSNSTPILGTTHGINDPTWSISAEMISYIIFGLLSLYPIGKRKTLLFSIIILLSVLFSIYNQAFFTFSDYGFVRGVLSFYVGYFVWKMSQKAYKFHNKLEYGIPIILILLFYWIHYLSGITKQMVSMIAIPTFFGTSLFLLVKSDGILSKFLITKPVQYLGKISFSIYLNHYLMIRVIPLIMFRWIQIPQNTFSEVIVFGITIFITILYSIITYRYVELRGGNFLRKRTSIVKVL
ncbi:acyltransferase [Aquimarina sp. RZ0]|uniref:acyltransferase family protein n=1 Tax=Aquimarina sp. RZ0 TaxID=2607730 RepID=UPI0011F244A5|nr:acyltransferase [Aquimarina sp. RZ0]KAA1242496.1 acyltransferase [Aquimarina sp. RZ0]